MFDELITDPILWAEDDELAFQLTVAEWDRDVPDDRHILPDELEEMIPGVFLAAVLSSVNRSKLSGHDVVRLMQADSRLVSHFNARYYADMVEVAHAYDPDSTERDSHPAEFAPEEVQAALSKTRRAAEMELGLALDLCRRMPGVWDALETGAIDVARARVFARELESVHPASVPTAVDRVISEASELTTGQLRARLQRISLELDPQAAEDRLRAGVEDRRMRLQANPDHSASLLLHNLDPMHALLAARYVHGLAMRLKRRPGERRTLDQLKVDIATDLLQGKTIDGAPPAPTPVMLILDRLGGHVPGYGTVLPETVRQLIEDAPLELNRGECRHETSSRRPTGPQARHIAQRYPTCVFPGCRIPATDCDIDHRQPWVDGGATTCHNLAPLCRHHHVCKTRWRLERDVDGSHIWTSPLDHTYRTGRPP